MNDETMREGFEEWVSRRHGCSTEKWYDTMQYKSHLTRDWWECWQAAMNTLAQASAPEGVHESAGVVLDEYRIAKYRLADKKAMENSDQWSHADEVSCMQTALDKCGYTRSNAKAGEVDARIAVAWIDHSDKGVLLHTLGECRALEDLPHGTHLYVVNSGMGDGNG